MDEIAKEKQLEDAREMLREMRQARGDEHDCLVESDYMWTSRPPMYRKDDNNENR